MALTVGTSGGNKDATEIYIGTASGNKAVTEGWVGTSGGNQQFFGATTIFLANASISDVQVDPSAASAQFWLKTDGVAYSDTITDGEVALYTWCSPSSAVGNYEVRATVLSGAVSGGSSATGSWLALSSSRNWRANRAVVGGTYASLLIEIRPSGGGATLASATIDLSAEVTV